MKVVKTIQFLMLVTILAIGGFYLSLPASTVSANSSVAACFLLLNPVCGVNGVTYDNSCFAQLAGVPIAHHGSCSSSPSDPFNPRLPVTAVPTFNPRPIMSSPFPQPTSRPIPTYQPPAPKPFPFPSWWTQPIASMPSIKTVPTFVPRPNAQPFPQSQPVLKPFPYPSWWTQPIPTM